MFKARSAVWILGPLLATACGRAAPAVPAGFAAIPAGQFEMGDHHGFVDPKHGGDETPLHTVRISAFAMAVNDTRTAEYCAFLNGALADRQVEVRDGGVYLAGGRDLLCETRTMSPSSPSSQS